MKYIMDKKPNEYTCLSEDDINVGTARSNYFNIMYLSEAYDFYSSLNIKK